MVSFRRNQFYEWKAAVFPSLEAHIPMPMSEPFLLFSSETMAPPEFPMAPNLAAPDIPKSGY